MSLVKDNQVDSKNLESKWEEKQARFITPAANVYESENTLRIVLEVPGAKEDSLNIQLEKDILTIQGEMSVDVPEGYRPVRREFSSGNYFRKFQLNRNLDEEKMEATLKNGKLTLTFQKIVPEIKKIPVKSE